MTEHCCPPTFWNGSNGRSKERLCAQSLGPAAARCVPAPEPGEHTEEAMMEIGLNMDRILEAEFAAILL